MDIKSEASTRYFTRGEFVDSRGNPCHIQVSSCAVQGNGDQGPFIWLGHDKIGLKEFNPGEGWTDHDEFDEPDDFPHGRSFIANTSMHLSQEQVRELLPFLQKFVETGDLPVCEGEHPYLDGTADVGPSIAEIVAMSDEELENRDE